MATTNCSPRLKQGAGQTLRDAYARYPTNYDEVLDEVHARLVARGAATKLDLAALVVWKLSSRREVDMRWVRKLLEIPEAQVADTTAKALARGLTDRQRVDALSKLPGFGSGGPFTSVLLTAWDQSQFGVYDTNVNKARRSVLNDPCTCDWSSLPT